MSQAFRNAAGGRIDRQRPIRFSFDGRVYGGFEGDTLASALLANGVHLVGRSFKYHRPRGIVSAGAEEPNALIRVMRDAARCTPNLRATQIEIYDGLIAESQNRFPSLAFDVGALSRIAAPMLGAGFYYKTFMWPAWGWKRLYEPAIRAMAGLGRAPALADPDHYAQTYVHCDVLVIGGGPAGLAAAAAAAETGARVVLCDEQAEFGGSALAERPDTAQGDAAHAHLAQCLAVLRSSPDAILLARTTAFGVFAQNFVALVERVTDHLANPGDGRPRERLWQVRAKQIVVATGAIERPVLFDDNDRPGVMLAEAARTYATRYGVRPGSRVVVATATDMAYRAALDLANAGVEIAAIADCRAHADGPWAHEAQRAGLPVRLDNVVTGTAGRLRVRSANLRTESGVTETVACDLVVMSNGVTPTVHLYSQARGALKFDAALGAFLPGDPDAPLIAAGACRGVFDPQASREDGAEAGRAAAARALHSGAVLGRNVMPAVDESAPAAPRPPTASKRCFVDFQNDVTAKDLADAVQEGFVSIEHVKRYTTVGMATDQGKTSNITALGLVAGARGTEIPAVGLTTFRMPYTPVTFGTLAGAARGALFDPERHTPLHDWAGQQGAVFEDVALWKRARYFPKPGETMDQAVARECRAVRGVAGIFDGSTLGKIEVVGPDAALFLERIYVNGFRKLPVGRARYGVMLREDGFILDDGVIGRLAEDRFHVTTTTGGAPQVLARMEDYLQTEWPELNVWLTSTTEQWAVIAVQGPAARDILAPLVDGVDMAGGVFPHMSVAEGTICGVPLRLFRVSFTGELGFEVNVPAGFARAIWERIWERGDALGMVPYGTESMHVLRAEKGYIIIGQEADGTVTPDDAGVGWAINRGKGDFVGKRSLARAAMAESARKQLVGLLTRDPAFVLPEGAQITADATGAIPRTILGHVTSSYFSAALGRSMALAMVSNGRARVGETMFVPGAAGAQPVQVASPIFYDPEGGRLNG